MISAEIRCLGRVQGVFFRKYTSVTAKQLGITGWVRNEPDGSVLIYAEGEDKAIEKMIEWCHSGSPSANVEDVKILSKREISNKRYHSFEVEH